MLIAEYKETGNKVEKLIYSINGKDKIIRFLLLEIKAVDQYQDDEDFVSAIKEDYPIIISYTKYQIDILQELEALDKENAFLKSNTTAALEEKLKQITKERDEFSLFIDKKDKIIEEKPADEIFL